MASSPKRIVVVLGMHRSGTSALARGLEALSLDLGDRLIGPIPGDNDRGFWEDAELNRLNDSLLQKLDSGWHRTHVVDAARLKDSAFDIEREAARRLLKAKIDNGRVFAFKDPRTSLLVPFWRTVFRSMRLRPLYVIAVRNPLEVAASLSSRNHFAQTKGLLLWAKYSLSALEETDRAVRIFISYESLLSNPLGELNRIARAGGLELLSEESLSYQKYVTDFLSPVLRRHVTPHHEVLDGTTVPGLVTELYLLLTEASSGALDPSSRRFRRRSLSIAKRFRSLAPLMDYVDRNEVSAEAQRVQLEKVNVEAIRLEARVEQSRIQDETLREKFTQLTELLTQERLRASEARSELRQREGTLAEVRETSIRAEMSLNAEIDRLGAEVEHAKAARLATLEESRSIEVRAAIRESVLEAATSRLKEAEETLIALRAQLVASQTELEDRTSQLAASQRELDTRTSQLAASQTELDARTSQLAASRTELNARVSQLAVSRTELDAQASQLLATRDGLQRSEERVAQLREQLERLRVEVGARDQTVLREVTLRQAAEQSLRKLRANYAATREVLAGLTEAVGQLGAARHDSEADRDRAIEQRNLLRDQWTRREASESATIGVLRQQLTLVTSSRSWRVTEPLRWFMIRLRNWRSLVAGRSSSTIRSSRQTQAPAGQSAPSSPQRTSADGELAIPYRRNAPIRPAVKVIAFYLPQFHPFPENDAWWGKGFTEWSNVMKARPLFTGHYQPHFPTHFGYYDLRVPRVLQEQAALAKEYGISGFSYYFYWFGGRVLMERPLLDMLANPNVDMPFCLIWANENWTRRWDGLDDHVLIAQEHSSDDSLAFIQFIDKYFRDSRYITVNGKPLLIIYKATLIPDIQSTIALWRAEAERLGWPGLYLVAAQSFDISDPSRFGFDAVVQFPPHHPGSRPPADVATETQNLSPGFNGHLFDYRDVVARALALQEPAYKLFRTAMLSWDNTARRGNGATIYHGFSLNAFRVWLEHIVSLSLNSSRYSADEKLVFINAWNEWAEGTHLEPDAKYGYGYLQATYDAISQSSTSDQRERPVVTVIVPNYNHAGYLRDRLSSVYRQTYRNFEVIILDDASTDDSVVIIEEFSSRYPDITRVVRNTENSGSVFAQWLTGIDLARGRLVWIAESDDSAHDDFLRNMVAAFDDESVLLAYGDIQYVNDEGKFVPGIDQYLNDTGSDQWACSYRHSAWQEFRGPFGRKNLIANVSGAVFRRPYLSAIERETLTGFRVCGDWYLYSLVARGGFVAYVSPAKSYFRLRPDSTSRSAYGQEWFYREHETIVRWLRTIYDLPMDTLDAHYLNLERLYNTRVSGSDTQLPALFDRRALRAVPAESLRICIATIGFYLGGGEIAPIDLANALRARGHCVTFFALGWEGGRFNSGVRNRLRADIPVVHMSALSEGFAALESSCGVQVTNTHNIGVDLYLYQEAYTPSGEWIVTQHGSYEAEEDRLDEAFVEFLAQHVGHWVVVAEKNMAPLLSKGFDPQSFTRIHNGAVKASGSLDALRGSERGSFGLGSEDFVFLLASRAISEKGWELAIRAVESARTVSSRNIVLLLAGDGPEADRLRGIYHERDFVYFLGFQEDVSRLIAMADAGLFPSYYEGESFPLFVMECLSQGRPVIASDLGECRQMLSEATETAGILIGPRHDDQPFVAELAEAVLALSGNSTKYEQASDVARRKGQYYTIEETSNAYEELFRSLLGNGIARSSRLSG